MSKKKDERIKVTVTDKTEKTKTLTTQEAEEAGLIKRATIECAFLKTKNEKK